jgi:beta-lactamase regulating signal transducer with metallopeptidase domain
MSSFITPATADTLNRIAEPWAQYVWSATWQAAAVALVVLVLVHMGRRMPAPLRAGLLCLAVIKLLLPPMVSAPTSIFRLAGPILLRTAPSAHPTPPVSQPELAPSAMTAPQQTVAVPVIQHDLTVPSSMPVLSSSPALSLPIRPPLTFAAKLMILHLSGAIVLAMWIGLSGWRLRKLMRNAEMQSSGSLYEQITAIAARLAVRPPRVLLISRQPLPPMAFGLLRRHIVLPQSLIDSLGASEIDAILAHELAHHRRHDVFITLLQLLSVVLWWFNPFAWLVGFELRRTREECCDDVVVGEGIMTAAEYCKSLLAAAKNIGAASGLSGVLALGEPMHPLGARMTRIMDPSVSHPSRLSRSMLAVILLLAVVLLPGIRSRAQTSPSTTAPVPVATAPGSSDPSNPSNVPVAGGARLTGTVVHEDGTAVADAEVFLLRRGRYVGTPDRRKVIAGPDGSFVMEGLAKADYRVWAFAGNLTSRVKRYGGDLVKVTEVGGQVGPIKLVMHAGREIDVSVTSATDGKAIPGARLHLTWTDTASDFTADDAGKCKIEALTAEAWQIEATAPGKAKVIKSANLASEAKSEMDFVLPDGGSIAGKVTDEKSAPLTKVELNLYPENIGTPIGFARTGDDGTYRFDNVPLDWAGEVAIFEKAYVQKSAVVKLSASQRDLQLNFTLEAKAFRSVDGTVVNASVVYHN